MPPVHPTQASYTKWPPELNQKEEALRKSLGVHPRVDGWYGRIGPKVRYICKPCHISEVVGPHAEAVARYAPGSPLPVKSKASTMAALADEYAAWLEERMAGKLGRPISPRTVAEYVDAVAGFVESVGETLSVGNLKGDHFTGYLRDIHKMSATTKARHMIAVRAFCKWIDGRELRPAINFGNDWMPPAIEYGSRKEALTPKQCEQLWGEVRDIPILRCAMLLGLTCGFSLMDVCRLPLVAVMADRIDYAREKVAKFGVPRLCPVLPPLADALAAYKRPPSDLPFFFVSERGTPMYRDNYGDEGYSKTNLIAERWRRAASFQFRSLRATFATLADDWPDQFAVDLMMGQQGGQASSIRRKHYVSHVAIDRLVPLASLVWQRAGGPSWAKDAPKPEAARTAGCSTPTGNPTTVEGPTPTHTAEPPSTPENADPAT